MCQKFVPDMSVKTHKISETLDCTPQLINKLMIYHYLIASFLIET